MKKEMSKLFSLFRKNGIPIAETIPPGFVRCFSCRNLVKKEEAIFDVMLHIYQCEKCFFRRSLDRPVKTSRKDQVLYHVLTRKRR